MSLCQRPIDTAIETCLTGRNHLLKTVEKRELWSQTSQCCLETELNKCARIHAEFPTHLETAWSKMPWIQRSNPHTSDTGVTSPSASGSEERVSNQGNLEMRNKLLCVKSSMCSGTQTSLKIWKRLINFPVGRIQRDVIWWSRGLESQRQQGG